MAFAGHFYSYSVRQVTAFAGHFNSYSVRQVTAFTGHFYSYSVRQAQACLVLAWSVHEDCGKQLHSCVFNETTDKDCMYPTLILSMWNMRCHDL